MSRLLARLAPVAALLVAVPAAAQKGAYVAPSDQTVTSYTEESMAGRPGHVVWVRNASTVPIHVFSVSLRDCENVKGYCGVSKVNIAVKPGGRSVIKRIDAADPDKGFGYRTSFSWRPDSSDVAALKTLASAGDANAARQLDERAEASAARGAMLGNPNYQLDPEAVVALGDRIHALRIEPDSVVVPAERFFLMRDVRVFAVDSAGQVLGRVRGFGWRWQPGNVQVLGDTIVGALPGRTKLEVRLAPPAPPVGAELAVIVTAAPPAAPPE
jgi:hypothetical protein